MQLTKVMYVAQFVSDQDRALDFYTRVLGLEKRADNPAPGGARFLGVGVPGHDFLLVLAPGRHGDGEPIGGLPPAGCTFETPDIGVAFETLRSRGVKFETDVLEHPWGWRAVFVDPDGNRLQIRQGR